jgi:hypothetical protein
MSIHTLGNKNVSVTPTPSTDTGSSALKTHAEPVWDDYRLSDQAQAHFDHIAERFQNDNDWSKNKDVKRLLSIMAEDKQFRSFMQNTHFRLQDPATLNPDAAQDNPLTVDEDEATPHQQLLLSLLEEPENRTALELQKFTTQLREELERHPQKYSVLLIKALHSEMTQHVALKNPKPLTPEAKERIAKLLKVADEYNRLHSTPTHASALQLEQKWLKMKDAILLIAGEKLPLSAIAEAPEDAELLHVPASISEMVKNTRHVIRDLEQVVKKEWPAVQQKRAPGRLRCRMNAVIQSTGRALAESMKALCEASEVEKPEEVYKVHEEGVLSLLARDALDMVGEARGRRLLDEDGRVAMAGYESEHPDAGPEELREKLLDVLSKQLKKETDQNDGLKKDLQTATEKAIRVYRDKREEALVKSYETIRHAKLKSMRLRTTIIESARHGNVLRNTPLSPQMMALTQAMEKQENCLRAAQAELKKQKPGLIKNLRTFGSEAAKAFADLNFVNGADKILKLVKSVPGVFIQLLKKVDKAIADPLKRNLLDTDFTRVEQAELSALMVPLDSVAKRVNAFADPLVSSAASLKRIRSKTKLAVNNPEKTQVDKAEMNTLDGSAPETPGGRICQSLLNAMLGKKDKVVRRDTKQEGLEEKVAKQVADLQQVLPHIKQQLGAEFEKKGVTIETKYYGDTRAEDYFPKVKYLRDKYLEVFSEVENKISAAVKPDRKGDARAAEELYDAVRTLKNLTNDLSRHIRSISAEELGYEFGYDEFDKVIAQDLLKYAAQECDKSFEEWVAAAMPEELHTAALKDNLQQILMHIKAEITDPERNILRRKKDPENALLVAALDQEFSNMLSRLQDKAPTLDTLLAAMPNCTDSVLKKVNSKAVSGVIYGALSLATDGALVSGLVESALGMTQLQRYVNPLRYKPLVEGIYQYVDSNEKEKVKARFFEVKDRHKIEKLQFRKLTRMAVNIISAITPAFAALPFTLPVALYGAATRPKFFIESVKSGLLLDAGIASAFEGYSEFNEALDDTRLAAVKAHYDHIKSHIRDRIALREPITLDIEDEQVARAYVEVALERIEQLKQEKEAKQKEAEKAQALKNVTSEDGSPKKEIRREKTDVPNTAEKIADIRKRQTVTPIKNSNIHGGDAQTGMTRVKRSGQAAGEPEVAQRVQSSPPVAEDNTVAEPQNTQSINNLSDEEINAKFEESFNAALEESIPVPEDTEGAISDPRGWIDKYNHDLLKRKGIPPNFKGSYDWDDRIEVYRSVDASNAKKSGYYVPDDEYLGTVTFREYSMGLHLRKGWGDPDSLKLVPLYDSEQARSMLKALEKTDLQKDYINAVGNYFNKSEIKELSKSINTAKLRIAVSDHSKYSNSPVGYNLKEIHGKIERGEVKTFTVNGKNVTDMVGIKTDGAKGYIIVSLSDGKVYEVDWDDDKGEIKFKNKQQAQECWRKIKYGLSYFNMKDTSDVKISNDGIVNNINKSRTIYNTPFVRSDFYEDMGTEEHTIEFSRSTSSFQDQLLNNKVENLKSDIDSAIYSHGERLFDYWVDIVGTVGTLIGVFALPFTGGASGAGISTGAKVLNFLSSAGFSLGVTTVTGVFPKLLQAAVAPTPEARDAALNDAYMALLGEGLAYGGGKLISKIPGNAFNKLAKNLKLSPETLAGKWKKRFEDWSRQRYNNFMKRMGKNFDDVPLSPKGASTPSSNSTAESSTRSFGSGGEYDSFDFIDDTDDLQKISKDKFSKMAKDFDKDLTDFERLYGRQGTSALHNEQKYRTMSKLLESKGYKVEIGYISVTNEANVTSKNMVLKVSQPGMEDGYLYFKDNIQGGNAGVGATVFNEKHGAKVFNREDFSKNYVSDMNVKDDYVNIRWTDRFTDPGTEIPPAEIVNTPKWKQNNSLESLESKNSPPDGSAGRVETEDLTYDPGQAPLGVAVNKTSVDTATKLGNVTKQLSEEEYANRPGTNPVEQSTSATGPANDPIQSELGNAKSFGNLADKVNKPDSPLTFTNAPEGTVVVGTSLHLVGPSADNSTGNITVYHSHNGTTNTSSLSSDPNTDVGKAVTDAKNSTDVNYADNQNRITQGSSDTHDQALVDHANSIKTKFGLDSHGKVQNLKSPVVLVVDTRKIPGYTLGTPLSTHIPGKAIVGVITEKDRVEETAIYFEQITGRKIPVRPIKVELKEGVYVTGKNESWNDVINNIKTRYPGMSNEQIYSLLQAANTGKNTQYPGISHRLPERLALLMPKITPEQSPVSVAQLENAAPAESQTAAPVQPETTAEVDHSIALYYITKEGESWESLGIKYADKYPGKTPLEVSHILQHANPFLSHSSTDLTSSIRENTQIFVPAPGKYPPGSVITSASPGESLDSTAEKYRNRYPFKTKEEVLALIQNANFVITSQYSDPETPFTEGTLLLLPPPPPLQENTAAPAQPTTVTSVPQAAENISPVETITPAPAEVANNTTPKAFDIHKTVKGDTLSEIASTYMHKYPGMSSDQIIKMIKDANRYYNIGLFGKNDPLTVGMNLKIPFPQSQAVEPPQPNPVSPVEPETENIAPVEVETPRKVKIPVSDSPESYVTIEGETLREIGAKFLHKFRHATPAIAGNYIRNGNIKAFARRMQMDEPLPGGILLTISDKRT